jgi:hypothetical protein
MGNMTQKSIDAIEQFAKDGGHVLAIGDSSMNLVRHLKLPLKSALVEVDAQGNERNLPNTKFYVPGSVLRMQLNRSELTWGLSDYVDCMFDDSPVFKLTASDEQTVKVIARFDTDKPLRSGWAWGQEFLKDSIAVADVSVGQGRVVLYGPEVLFRAQPTQTFKLVFNGILRAGLDK